MTDQSEQGLPQNYQCGWCGHVFHTHNCPDALIANPALAAPTTDERCRRAAPPSDANAPRECHAGCDLCGTLNEMAAENAARCLCGGPWPCPDIDAPNYRPEAYARHGAAPPSEDAVPLDVERLARAMNKVRPYGGNPSEWAKVAAAAIAREYAALEADR